MGVSFIISSFSPVIFRLDHANISQFPYLHSYCIYTMSPERAHSRVFSPEKLLKPSQTQEGKFMKLIYKTDLYLQEKFGNPRENNKIRNSLSCDKSFNSRFKRSCIWIVLRIFFSFF